MPSLGDKMRDVVLGAWVRRQYESAWEEKCASFMAFDGGAVSAPDLRRRLGAGRRGAWVK